MCFDKKKNESFQRHENGTDESMSEPLSKEITSEVVSDNVSSSNSVEILSDHLDKTEQNEQYEIKYRTEKVVVFWVPTNQERADAMSEYKDEYIEEFVGEGLHYLYDAIEFVQYRDIYNVIDSALTIGFIYQQDTVIFNKKDKEIYDGRKCFWDRIILFDGKTKPVLTTPIKLLSEKSNFSWFFKKEPSPVKIDQNACSFKKLNTLRLVITLKDETIQSTEGNEIELYVDSQTKDSVIVVYIGGEMGMATYKFIFNKDLKVAEYSVCNYAVPIYIDPDVTIISVEKKSLKSSEKVKFELTEEFSRIRKTVKKALSQ
jgi:hypothetical protein